MYYAVEYAYGGTAANGWPMSDSGGGGRADIIHRFDSAAKRDAWVKDGPEDFSAAGYRAPLRADSRPVRRVLASQAYF